MAAIGYGAGELLIDSMILENNRSETSGRAISLQGNVEIINSRISDNEAADIGLSIYRGGGGVYALGNVLLAGSTLRGNTASGPGGGGGGIIAYQGDVIIEESLIEGNTTTGDLLEFTYNDVPYSFPTVGGAIPSRSVSITNSTLRNNHTFGKSASGGGVNARFVTVIGSLLEQNSTTGDPDTTNAPASGGAIVGLEVSITDSTIRGNYTLGKGASGGVDAVLNLVIDGSSIQSNWTAGENADGGAISGLGDLTVNNSSFTGNDTDGPSLVVVP